ncbi:FUSC family protein [Macrococcus armenti]|uniref:FUSC family protein n=1 Tax=Macrococcus armenti TaxID=2875764 RepID=UPI001CCF1B1A|nr:aromatic acid exporter family protein [Macrococcus armenti]UBH10413.1 aromatic acid exporter family protein [Macrococcus armenti]UBH14943.1 aromatic acid exporter family protein [Macrococcus armenti]UBH17303.1 aromatic acid exporter family protein [Macrococcus armenti]UBH19568.1 aromatic acid exporter family protein [Macrococcus armenti]
MKLGARIFKTGIAIIVALFIAHQINAPGAIVAGISALFAMQPNVYRSFKTIIEQFQGNLIGAFLAVAMATLFGFHIVIIGITSIILISILQRLNLSHVTGLAVVTQLIIMDHQDGDFIQSAILRFTFVMIGVISAFVVNTLFLPPKFESKIYYQCLNISSDIFKWIRLEINGSTEFHAVKRDIDNIRNRIEKLEEQYNLYKEERAYTKKGSIRNLRKKIIFKETVLATRRAHDVLRKVHRYENDVINLPEELKVQIKFELDELMTLHEELLMRISKKVPATKHDCQTVITEPYKLNIMDAFLEEINANPSDDYNKEHIFVIIGTLFDYRDKLEHLDSITHSFYKYHKEDKKFRIENQHKT